MSDHSEANRRWENQVQEFQQTNSYRELLGIDGEPIEFEWNIFSRVTSLEILQKIQIDLRDRNIEPEKFEDRIIFMSMFNDIEWIQMTGFHRHTNGGTKPVTQCSRASVLWLVES